MTRLGRARRRAVIDKLDLRIPPHTGFSRAVAEFTRGLPYSSFTTRVRPAVHYSGKADLRPIGIDALLHLQCKHGERSHKLEILDAGKKPYSEITALIERVTDASPENWGIMRVDLAADVRDVSVDWARKHVRFKFKRTSREYGELKYGVIGKGNVETITAGCRPNLFRVYDKVTESKLQFNRMLRKQSPDSEPLEFEKEFGFKETDTVTRFERQCGSTGIPPELSSFGDLHRAPQFNPFGNVEIIRAGQSQLPEPEDCEGIEYFTGMGLRAEAQRRGMQDFRKLLNRQTKGNAARTLDRYGRFFNTPNANSFSIEALFDSYRESILRQLSA
jgi:hypothetical protein